MDRTLLYDMIYALAARNGREDILFGNCAPLAREAFARSLASDAFPELWFELPLAGGPWFDLHALTAREDLKPGIVFSPEACGGCTETFEWFAMQKEGVRQLALSWDVSSNDIAQPAVQLLVKTNNPETTCEFLAAARRPDAAASYRAFIDRLPKGWFACYTGVFPARPGHNLRVECIPKRELQRAYANDADLIERDLRQAGLHALGETVLSRCQKLASMPFQFEFQFDIEPDGTLGHTLGASARFASPPGSDTWHPFDMEGAAGELMHQIEAWGLADSRWRHLTGTMFAKHVSRGDAATLLYCYPAFIKLRWKSGEPIDAKTYLIAGTQ